MASKDVAVKKYVVRLSKEERARLEEFIRKGKRAGHLLTKARILLKADVSEVGDGWSDSRIAEALDTSIATVERTRRQLVEEGFEAVLTRKYNPNSAPRRIFDGAAEAKLMLWPVVRPRLAAPNGPCVSWRRRSSNCRSSRAPATTRSGARSKKHSQAPSQAAMGDRARGQRGLRRQHGRRAGSLPKAARSQASPRMPR